MELKVNLMEINFMKKIVIIILIREKGIIMAFTQEMPFNFKTMDFESNLPQAKFPKDPPKIYIFTLWEIIALLEMKDRRKSYLNLHYKCISLGESYIISTKLK